MQPDQAADYIAGIMRRNDVGFASSEDGSQHQVRYGSTAINIRCSPFGSDDAIVNVSAIILEELDPENAPTILPELNRLNADVYFGKFTLYGDTIRVEHDLLASRMQGEEFMNALGLVAEHADNNDEDLQKKLGGKTWAEVDEALRADNEALDT